MKEFKIYVCDDAGNRIYFRIIRAKNLYEAKTIAWQWCMQVEAEEGWFTTYDAEEI